MHLSICDYLYAYIFMLISLCIYPNVYFYTQISICISSYVYTYVDFFTGKNTNAYKDANTYMYIHTCSSVCSVHIGNNRIQWQAINMELRR